MNMHVIPVDPWANPLFLEQTSLFCDKHVFSEFCSLILAPAGVCLATRFQIQARNRQKGDGHVFNKIPGNRPTHTGARVEFLAPKNTQR